MAPEGGVLVGGKGVCSIHRGLGSPNGGCPLGATRSLLPLKLSLGSHGKAFRHLESVFKMTMAPPTGFKVESAHFSGGFIATPCGSSMSTLERKSDAGGLAGFQAGDILAG